MTPGFYEKYLKSLKSTLSSVEVTDRSNEKLSIDQGIAQLCKFSQEVLEYRGKQFLCGNGASAAFSTHMALDWSKNARVPTFSFGDAALLTANANDLGVTEMFAAAIRFYAGDGDLLVTISSSGNSPNILRAIEVARSLSLKVVTISGLRPDNACRALGDLNFYFPAKTYGIVECSHQVLLHIWLDSFMQVREWDCADYQNMRTSDHSGHLPT